MGIFDWFRPECRSDVPNNTVRISHPRLLEIVTGLQGPAAAVDIPVTVDSALGVPAVWAAVQFISGTIAGLPVHVYQRNGDNRDRVDSRFARMLHDAVNPELSKFDWLKYTFEQVLTGGRGLTFIERNARREVIALWPLDPIRVSIKRENSQTTYTYSDGGRRVIYQSGEVIDLAFMLKPDGVSHRGPIQTNRDAIAMSIAATHYGARYFNGGGVPPFTVTGNFQSPNSMQAAADDMAKAVRKAAKERRHALTLPAGLEVKPLGSDAEKAQLVEVKRFCIEEIARIYQFPPVFLQDLTRGTYSNTEQQDLHVTKHTIKRWVEQFEQQVNLKIFGQLNGRRFIEFDMNGLMRGDFSSRMAGYAAGIQHGVYTPMEARRRENLPEHAEADRLFVQGAIVPLDQQINPPPALDLENENVE